MKFRLLKFLSVILFATIVLAVYSQALNWHLFALKACAQPITYSLGTFDNRFNISQEQFLADINKAVQIWDQPINKTLFQYSPAGKLKINLVYDFRQAATDKLKSLGFTIDDSESSYDVLKARYDSSTSDYKIRKQKLDAAIAAYEQQRKTYEQLVDYWNAQGGAPRNMVEQLNKQRDQLTALAADINRQKDELNALVDSINAMASTLNRLGSALNLNVSQYNNVGSSRGQEFEEGVYQSDSSGQKIEIYEFDSQNKLVRVLAHELGHALGLEHINSNPAAIMYYLNQGKNQSLTAEDVLAVKQLCGLQK